MQRFVDNKHKYIIMGGAQEQSLTEHFLNILAL